jgi:hypothetical protein
MAARRFMGYAPSAYCDTPPMTATVSPAPRARLTSRTPTHRAGLVDDLTRLAQRWARGVAYDEERLVVVRNALLDDTATHAAAHLPIYRRLVRELGATPRAVGHRRCSW